jgi:hypothetical protein
MFTPSSRGSAVLLLHNVQRDEERIRFVTGILSVSKIYTNLRREERKPGAW